MVEDDDDDILDVTNQKMTAFRQTKKAKVTEEKLKKEKVFNGERKAVGQRDGWGGLKNDAWQRIMVDLNANFRLEYSVEQIKSHFNQMVAFYRSTPDGTKLQ
ncbi:hypothetical protein BC829DRAFT_422266 [Chytridium lagenaria]|nr:hypothetical protein BC829DRAFT_422266 [Chytridium lagenaria]